jgi:hypothetical protein
MTALKKARKQKQPTIGKGGWLTAIVMLPAVEAVICLVLIFYAPSEIGDAWLLGLSVSRWSLVAFLAVVLFIFSYLAWLNLSNQKHWLSIERNIRTIADHRYLYAVILGLSLVIAILLFYVILLAFKFTDLYVLARLQRLLPIILWIFLFSLQTVVILPQIRFDKPPSRKSTFAWGPTWFAMLSLALVAALVWMTRLGLQPDKVGWDNPGVPLMGTQVATAIVLAILVYAIARFFESRLGWKISRLDWLISLLLWLVAVWWWQSQPLMPTFFSPTPRAPNFEFYPFSDAASHDVSAQNLLVGDGFPDVLEKPLYGLFLASIHALVGQQYEIVVFAQITVLALFPAVLYFLGRRLHHRISGAILAFAVIIREANAIELSGDIRVSHAKLLMTDLPAAFGIAVFTLALLSWFRIKRENIRWQLSVGGALGLLALLRSQVIIFLPALLLIAFIKGSVDLRKRFTQAVVVLLGFALALFPWLVRNYQVSGQFGYSQPLQAVYLAKQYSLAPELAKTGFPEGTRVADYVSLGFSKVVQFTLDHPAYVAGFVSAHFSHNEISALLSLPTRFDLADKLVTFYNLQPYWIGQETKLWAVCCSLQSFIASAPYWQNWGGVFPPDTWLPVLANLVFISIGIGAAWKKVGRLTLVPIGIHLLYNLSTAVARVSGWRLILPVDWVILMFYSLGIGQIGLWMWNYFAAIRQKPAKKPYEKPQRGSDYTLRNILPWATVIMTAGLILPLAEMVIPPRFENLNTAQLQLIWDNSVLPSKVELNITDFLSQPNADVRVGEALYPRFYPANSGEPGQQGSAFGELPFSRIAFQLIGPIGDQVALPLESSSIAFPNASDVVALGCTEGSYFRAAAVIFTNDLIPDLLADNADPFLCPP